MHSAVSSAVVIRAKRMVGMSMGSECGFVGAGEGMVGGSDEDGCAVEMEMETEVGMSGRGGVLVTVMVVVLSMVLESS